MENYVKAIYKISHGEPNHRVTTGQLAAEVNVSPGTVTSMLKTLDEHGLATYTPYEGVRLTETGRTLALDVVRRHRLIELLLAEVLGVGWDEVHDDAERIEHVVSERLIERIDDYLGHPRFDPHGDPIPRADGTLPEQPTVSLAECGPGTMVRIAQVTDQSGEFLRYLSACALAVGAEGEVLVNDAGSGEASVEVDGRRTTLAREAAERVRVVVLTPHEPREEGGEPNHIAEYAQARSG